MKRRSSKHLISLIIGIILIITCTVISVFAKQGDSTGDLEEQCRMWLSAKDVIPGEIVVCFSFDKDAETMYNALNNVCTKFYPDETKREIEDRITFNNEYNIQLINVEIEDELDILVYLNESDEIYCATPNAYLYPDELDTYDPGTSSTPDQWHLDTIGAAEAWAMGFEGDSSTIVAVLDTGYTPHPEMYDNINTSLAYNVYADTTSVGDVSGHGTHIEGIIGAALDGYGTNGICKNVTIVPIKISNDVDHKSTLYYMGLGVQRATSMGAKVINLSFTMPTCNNTFKSYINSFGNLFVTTAGNNSIDIESDSANAGKVNDEPLWIVVGSMTSSITKSGFSNYNEDYVDLFAPGSNILSLDLSNGYTLKSGTSMAAPMVAAAVALIASHATHLSPAEIKEYILDNCIQTNAFGNLCVSGGYLYLPSVIEQIYSENRGAYSRGDGNGDGYITSVDYAMCRRTVLGTYTPTPQQAAALDINGNGVVDSTDYAKISRYILRTFYFIP